MTLDRSAIARALAKAIAYKQCNQDDKANQYARELINLLECADILNPFHSQSPANQSAADVCYLASNSADKARY